ncbi:hypothetical protein PSPO01_04243 [Paraphaeosphaeria sporulosa]
MHLITIKPCLSQDWTHCKWNEPRPCDGSASFLRHHVLGLKFLVVRTEGCVQNLASARHGFSVWKSSQDVPVNWWYGSWGRGGAQHHHYATLSST